MVLYYTPDSENNIEPRTLKPEGKVYTYDEALEVWRGKGGESPRLSLFLYHIPLPLLPFSL